MANGKKWGKSLISFQKFMCNLFFPLEGVQDVSLLYPNWEEQVLYA